MPAELKAMFDQSVSDIISNMVGDLATAEARFLVDLIESEMAILIDKVMKTYPSVYIKSNPLSWKDTVRVEIHLTSRGEKAEHVKETIDKAAEMQFDRVKNLVQDQIPLKKCLNQLNFALNSSSTQKRLSQLKFYPMILTSYDLSEVRWHHNIPILSYHHFNTFLNNFHVISENIIHLQAF